MVFDSQGFIGALPQHATRQHDVDFGNIADLADLSGDLMRLWDRVAISQFGWSNHSHIIYPVGKPCIEPQRYQRVVSFAKPEVSKV